MSVTRGKFLKELGKSLPGMVLGGGVAAAAHKVLGKIAAVSAAGNSANHGAVEKTPLPAANEATGEFIMNGPATANRIALTFDDGPEPGVTDLVLDELKRRGVRATFFMIGNKIAAAPDLARRVLAEGHEIGNHSFTHPDLSKLPDAKAAEEIRMTQGVMRDVLEHRPKWFRPPYGGLRRNQAALVTDHDMRIIFWTIDTEDWKRPAPSVEQLTAAALSDLKPGAIILFHDTHANTAKALAPILAAFDERHLVASTLSELLE